MKQSLTVSVIALVLSSLPSTSASAATCAATGFFRDGINMTAALINPTTIPPVVDATGCNIGIYFDNNMVGTGTVDKTDVYGANYFGILVNGDAGDVTVNVTNSVVHNIGEVPFNGTQHGAAIYLRSFFTFTLGGTITGNKVFAYQKGGIVANGRGTKVAQINNNVVTGEGHVTYIAQNGIQIGYGARPGQVVGNTVSGNSYIGTPGDGSASGGLLLVGGPGYGTCPDGADCPYTTLVLLAGNGLFNNDVGIYSSNLAADGVSTSPTPTNIVTAYNLAGSDFCYNQAYQAGISDQGNTDYIVYNHVTQGGGYGPACGLGIDTTGSINPVVVGNNVAPVSTAVATASLRSAGRTLRVQPIQ